MSNKIGWCDMTFNPVWGCRNHCEYCYARKIARRFSKKILFRETYFTKKYVSFYEELDKKIKKFEPVFLEHQFNKKFPKKPQRIFVGSMSEIYYWREEWIEMVIEKVKQYPQHTFMFLTQHPEVYAQHLFPSNCWLGVTLTKNKLIQRAGCISKKKIRFLSIEPILEKIDIEIIDDFKPDWVIIGAETGNRKGKVIPEKEWLEVIIHFCKRTFTPLYIKDNVIKYFPEFRYGKQFPKGVK